MSASEPGLVLCKGDDCPLQRRCYRANAEEQEGDIWFPQGAPYDHEEGVCVHFLPLTSMGW